MRKYLKYRAILGALVFSSCDENDDSIDQPIDVKPVSATLVFPDNNQICQTGTSVSDSETRITFEWNASERTNSYDLVVNNISDLSEIKATDISGTTQEVTLKKGERYAWKVFSKNSDSDQSSVSETWRFYMAGDGIINYAPFPATITAPVFDDEVTIEEGKVTLQWEGADPDSEDLNYTIYLDAIDGKQTPSSELTNIESNSVDVEVEADTQYFWRVKTSDGDNSSFSIVYKFKTK